MQRLTSWIPVLLAVLIWNGGPTCLWAAQTFFDGNMETDIVYGGGHLSGDQAHEGSFSEQFSGDNRVHEHVDFAGGALPSLDPGATFSCFTYAVWIYDGNNATQTYKLGIRFAKKIGSSWHESDYYETADHPVGSGWQKLSFNITTLVNHRVQEGYTHISRFSIRAYNSGTFVDYAVDDVLLNYIVAQDNRAPAITDNPDDVVVHLGDNATFTVQATGTAPLHYQWFRNDTDHPISGATQASYTLEQVSNADNNGHFFCRVSNGCGSATSEAATLTVTSDTTTSGLAGDLNGDGTIDLRDEIRALQVLVGLQPVGLTLAGDVNDDNRIGPAEAVAILEKISHTTVSSLHYQVYVGADAPPAEQHAAEELVHFLNQANVAISLTTNYDAQGGPYIIVGSHNDFISVLSDPPTVTRLGEDGYVFRRDGDNLLISGATGRGTLYGVYGYLRAYIGYEWYGIDTTEIPHLATGSGLPIPSTDETHIPRFRYRAVFNPEAGEPTGNDGPNPGADFAARIQLNGQLGHKTDGPAGEDGYRKGLLRARHGFGINAQGVYNIENNPGTAEATVTEATDVIREYGRYRQVEHQQGLWYPIIEHIDGGSHSDDPADVALVQANGGAQGAPLMQLTSQVAERLRNVFPQAIFLGQAYLWSLQPPTQLNLAANAGVEFAPIEADWGQPLNQGGNQQFADYLTGWTQHTDHIWTWLYSTNFMGYLQPLPNLYPMLDTIKYLASVNDVEGIFLQDSYETRGGSFAALHTWVFGRLMWDPSLDGDQLVRAFCNHYYGPAAGPYIYQYIQALHSSQQAHPGLIGTKASPASPYLNAALLIQADQLMQQAEDAAADNSLYLKHVQIERMGVDWIMLLNSAQLQDQARRQGLTWPDASESQRQARLARFRHTVLDIAGVETFGEGMGGVDMMLSSLEHPRTIPEPPFVCRHLDRCIDFQDFGFQLSEAELISDALASDHGSARMAGNTPAWGIQVPLQLLLPESGAWNLYADIRVEPGDQPDYATAAINGGIDPTPHWREIALKGLADGAYHTIRLPGGPYSYNSQQYIWFSPPDSDNVHHIYVDRVFAVPATASALESRCPAGSGLSNCRLLNEWGLDTFMEMSSFVADAQAEDGWAAYMQGGYSGWGIQANLGKLLPASGRWKVYAAIRIRKHDTVADSAKAFDWGVEGRDGAEVSVGTLADEHYHLLEVPGGSYARGEDSGLYFMPATGQIDLFVDYLVAVPVE